jgi:tetratricopeptide (TPR) repeat protein
MKYDFRRVRSVLGVTGLLGLLFVAAVQALARADSATAATVREFRQRKDEALFQALGPTGRGLRERRKAIQEATAAALQVVGISGAVILEAVDPPGGRALKLDGYTPAEAQALRDGCGELLLLLAESHVEPLPGQSAREYQGEVSLALGILDAARKLLPAVADLRAYHLRRARYLELLHRDARDEWKAAAHTPPRGVVDSFLMGDDFFRQGDLERARGLFEAALGRQPDFWCSYYLALCSLQEAGGDDRGRRQCLERARGHLDNCLADAATDAQVWTLLLRGLVFANLENYPAAEADFQKALDLAGGRDTSLVHALYNNRGVMRIGRGKIEDGIADLKEALKIHPERFPAHLSLAQAYELQKHADEAEKKYGEAISVAQQQVQDRELEATVLAQLYRLRGFAHEQFLTSDEALRDRATAREYYQAALRYHRHAVEVCERALKEAGPGAPTELPLRQSLAWGHFDRGRLYHGQGQSAEAVTEFDAALHAGADADLIDRLGVQRWRGDGLLRLGRNDEAIGAFDQYLGDGLGRQLFPVAGLFAFAAEGPVYTLPIQVVDPPRRRPDAAAAYAYRARAFARARLGQHKAALQDCGRALAIEPDNAETYAQRGRSYLALESYGLAEMDFDRAIQLNPGESTLYANRGYTRIKRGQLAPAVSDADTALALARKADAAAGSKVVRLTPELLCAAARIYAQVVGQRDHALAPDERGTDLQRTVCQEQTFKLLRQALEALAPAERGPFWRSHVQSDPAFDPVRPDPGLANIAKAFGLPSP